MADKRVVVVTGISGSGSKELSGKYGRAMQRRGADCAIYRTGDIILKLAQPAHGPPMPAENLLNLNPRVLAELRDKAFDFIVDDIRSGAAAQCSRVVVDTHAQFFWNNVYTNAYNLEYLKKLAPDMFVTVIDKPSAIRQRQLMTRQGRAQNHCLERILEWQNVEVNVTEGWSQIFEKPMYVLPSRQQPLAIEALLHNAFLIYFSMPMTDADAKANERISRFKSRLLRVGTRLSGLPTPIIDPRDIDLEQGPYASEQERQTNEDHTVHRDLEWYIPRATHVVVCYPPGAPVSVGVSHEDIRAYESGKHVFIIYPPERVSPFMRKSHQVFRKEEEFFRLFPAHMEEMLELYRRDKK